MEKAWKRQFGADTQVTIDIEEQVAVLRLPTPREIDLDDLETSTDSVGHSLVRVQLETDGVLREMNCSSCDQERPFLELTGTEQRFEIDGPAPTSGRWRGTLTQDGPDHVRFSPDTAASE